MGPQKILKALIDREHERENSQLKTLELWKAFGASVRVERERRGISQSALAYELKCSRTFIGYLETGKRPWNLVMARQAVIVLKRCHGK